MLCVGSLTTFTCIPLLAFTNSVADGDFLPVNVLTLAMAVLSMHLPLYLLQQQRVHERIVLAEKLEAAATKMKGCRGKVHESTRP